MCPVVHFAGSCPRACCLSLDSTIGLGMVVGLDIVVVLDMLAVHGMAADSRGIAGLDMAAGRDMIDVPDTAADDLHTIADLVAAEFWPDRRNCAARGCRWVIRVVLSLR